ncbi:MAG: DUF799 family lipoprotein [bacterium]
MRVFISSGRRRAPRLLPCLLTVILAAVALAVTGCPQTGSESTQAVHSDYRRLKPKSIAVLPFDNMSTDLDATPLIRPIVAKRLRYKGYKVPDLKWADKRLQEAGVLIAHDVYSFTPEELGDILSVDAVMFGTVTDFSTKYAVLAASVTIQLRLELADCETGEMLWQNEQAASRNTIFESLWTLLMYQDEIETGVAVVAAQNVVFAALEDYYPYAEEVCKKNLSPLPPGPKGERPYPWDRDPNALDKSSVKSLIYQGPILTVKPE